VVAILMAWWGIAAASLGIGAVGMPLLLGLFCMLGAAQMYSDRANRVSGLLATLAVTRSRILAARVLAGAAVILAMLVLLLIAAIAILHVIGAPIAFFWRTIAEVSATLVLTSFACYCVGLLMGWTTNKAYPALSVLFGMFLIMLLLVVKGFGLAAIGLLLLFIAAALLCVWHRFTSVSL
jgi:ABC-type transport system involved in multi-copper enzyme maturation permease subunit